MREGYVPGVSWCLEGSLKFFHQDFKSRLLGGEAGVEAGGVGWDSGLPWYVFGFPEVMLNNVNTATG